MKRKQSKNPHAPLSVSPAADVVIQSLVTVHKGNHLIQLHSCIYNRRKNLVTKINSLRAWLATPCLFYGKFNERLALFCCYSTLSNPSLPKYLLYFIPVHFDPLLHCHVQFIFLSFHIFPL